MITDCDIDIYKNLVLLYNKHKVQLFDTMDLHYYPEMHLYKSHPSKINFFEKVGVGNTPVRGNFTIATKTNSYGKIIPFCTNNKHYAPAII